MFNNNGSRQNKPETNPLQAIMGMLLGVWFGSLAKEIITSPFVANSLFCADQGYFFSFLLNTDSCIDGNLAKSIFVLGSPIIITTLAFLLSLSLNQWNYPIITIPQDILNFRAWRIEVKPIFTMIGCDLANFSIGTIFIILTYLMFKNTVKDLLLFLMFGLSVYLCWYGIEIIIAIKKIKTSRNEL